MLSKVKGFVVNHPVETVILGVFALSTVASCYDTYKESSVERKYKAIDTTPEVDVIINEYKDGMVRANRLNGKIEKLEKERLERICLEKLEIERKKQKAAKKADKKAEKEFAENIDIKEVKVDVEVK